MKDQDHHHHHHHHHGCEDSGVATSGELGEPSCSGEYDEVICEVKTSNKKSTLDTQDPR